MLRLPLGRRRAIPFVRHISVLAIGTVLSQVTLVLASVLLARLYMPREFGEFSIALSLAMILAVLATGRLEMAVPLAEDDQEASTVAVTAMLFAILLSLALLALLVGYRLVAGRSWPAFGAGASAWLVPPAVAGLGALAAARNLQSRRELFSRVSFSRVTASLVQSVGQLAASPAGGLGLSAGFVAGTVWNAVSLSRGLRARPLSTWRAAAAKWRRFSLLLMVPSVLNVATVGAVAPAVALLYGVASSGLFTFSTRVLALPAVVIGQAVSGAFFPKVAELERKGQPLAPAMHLAVTGLTMASVPIFGLVLLLGPELFGVVFGDRWRGAGEMSAVLAPWLAVAFVSSPLSTLMTVKNELRRLLVLSLVEASLRLGSLSAGLIDGRAMTGIVAYSVSGCLICLYYVRWSLRLAGSSLRSWLRIVRGYLLVAAVAYPSLLATKGQLPLPWFGSLAAALTLLLLGWAAAWLYRHALVGHPPEPDHDGLGSEPVDQRTAAGSVR
ncbi:oligosaccharide flippase family protein [Micromonospora echinospora]|uniref:O-antigen/teichoic acid export membrane protein n=1 Tax=Micromonospora echinospora TaxID=1877 RepID=A0ABR6MCV0_MICEC|nr:oligosaccharide flippase family protein [Micromonospora echinospora]MBB5112909.1 O-antigen/teichoic acid export membrane protein [Micromonospora echinospora]